MAPKRGAYDAVADRLPIDNLGRVRRLTVGDACIMCGTWTPRSKHDGRCFCGGKLDEELRWVLEEGS